MGGSKWTVFRVIDTPEKLKAHEWDYVCSVFVLGTTWQFKNWFSGILRNLLTPLL